MLFENAHTTGAFRDDAMTIRDGQFVSWCSYITYNRHSYIAYNRRTFFRFHPHTLFTVETSLILPESHISAAVYMNYGKRVHNSPVSHAFTRPSNCRRPRRLRALPPFTLTLRLKIIRTTATGDIPSSATPVGISLTTWRVIIGECCHAEY